MELRVFAERVLTSTSIIEKLRAPSSDPSDERRGPGLGTIGAPGRPPELPLRGAGRVELPNPRQLHSTRDRIRVLHALANHELLALELFALALLRFVDVPAALRRAWAAAMRDEQRHLAAYRGRLEALGGHLGQEPLSAFFWDALSGNDDPLSFVAGMEVGLEQANLDFALLWADAFERVGDRQTAEILHQVHRDEIRHVRAGVVWLRRLKDPELSDWDAWVSALRFPLTPARGRGPRLDLEGRRAAGLDPAFIQRLSVTSVSRGRPPWIWWFDPQVEDALAGRGLHRSPVASDLAVLPALMARADDVVIAPRPSVALLLGWRDAGLPIPQFIDRLERGQLPGGQVGGLAPWGWSPGTAAASAQLGGRYDPRWRDLHDKAWAADWLRGWIGAHEGPWRIEDVGVRCGSPSEVDTALRRVLETSERAWVKAALSSAGRHRLRLSERPAPHQRRWIERALAHGDLLVEPDLDVVAEVSGHLDVRPDRLLWRGLVRFGATHGAFRGAIIGRPSLGLPPRIQRFLHQERVEQRIRECAGALGQLADARGYRGPLGLDALIVEGPDGLRLKPVSELNPRYTMGRIAHTLRHRIAGCGLWWFLPRSTLERAGLSPGALLCAAQRHLPPLRRDGRLRRGAVATNDPQTADQIVTLLWIGETWRTAVEAWSALLGEAPERAELAQLSGWISASPRPRSRTSADPGCAASPPGSRRA